jgi:cytochrome b involved in lipid metabolism
MSMILKAIKSIFSSERLCKEYTWKEIVKHKEKESCWVVINNKVYDVTTLLETHTGGYKAIFKYGGKDATEPFENIHHNKQKKILEKYCIGEIKK